MIERVKREMREAHHRGVEIETMKYAAREETFNASADTCTKAWNAIRSELGTPKDDK